MALHLKNWVTLSCHMPSFFLRSSSPPPAFPSPTSTRLLPPPRSGPAHQLPKTLTQGATANDNRRCIAAPTPPPVSPPPHTHMESDFPTSFHAQTWVEFSLKNNYICPSYVKHFLLAFMYKQVWDERTILM
jgi:hypothetical protein